MFSAVDTEVKTMGWKMQSFPWKKFCWIWPISFAMHQESYFHGRLRISQLLWHVAFWFIWRLERNDTPGQWSQSERAPIEIKDASFFLRLHRNPWLTHCVFVLTPQGFISIFLRCVCVLSLQSCPTLCDLMDCSPPGSSVHGILQARIVEWVAMPSSRGSSGPRDQTCVSCIAGGFFTVWAKVLNKCLLKYWLNYKCMEICSNGVSPRPFHASFLNSALSSKWRRSFL